MADRKLHLEAEIGTIADMPIFSPATSLDQLIAMKEMPMTGKEAAAQAERSSRLLIFVVGHLAFMANQLKSRHLAELETN